MPNEDAAQRDLVYEVIHKFSDPGLWNEFARSEQGLNIRQFKISAISQNYQNNVEERMYQMVDFWKSANGLTATSEKLEQLANDFLARQTSNPNRSNSTTTSQPQSQPIQGIQISGLQLRYRLFLMNLSNNLTEEKFSNLKQIFSPYTGNRVFSNAFELLDYLDTNNLWASDNQNDMSTTEKLGHIRTLIQNFNIPPVVAELDQLLAG